MPNAPKQDEQRCDGAPIDVQVDSGDRFSYQLNAPLYKGDSVLISLGDGTPQPLHVQSPPHFLGEEMRAIVGYQQAGASSSGFTQNWFVDFYISRPLALRRQVEGDTAKWRLWGNVRVASFPQPGNQSVADLATGFATQWGAVKLNQLAQGAEFLSGVEYQLFKSFPFRGFSENTRQVFTFGLIAGIGATGFFDSPSNSVQVFQVPEPSSPQFTTFKMEYPQVTTANVGFISPDVERFPKQYLGGFRLTTHYVSPSGMPLTSAPAMLAFTVGQNQVISGGQLRGVIGRIEAFYPLPFGNRGHSLAGAFSSLYLFGNAQMRLGLGKVLPPLALQSVSTPAYDPSVTLVASPSIRDTYRMGVGIDLVSFISSLTSGSSKQSISTGVQIAKEQ